DDGDGRDWHGGPIAAAPRRCEALPEGVQAGAVVQDVERLVCDNRRQADSRSDVGLALEGPGGGIDVDKGSVGTGDDQAATCKHRPRIIDFALLRLRLHELRKLVDPADMPVLASDAQKPRLVSYDEDPVAGDPGGRNAGDIELPLPLAGD